ncbi:cell division protein FtsX [Niveispirillum fermenti]|uniref:cell division protein FtsX n=1 Tax=Niveispirillum fermenti TaxID=1233113 RepID=UPI003A85B3F7
MMSRRAHFDIPLSQDATGRFLPWIIALMVYLASLALAASLVLSGLAQRWDSELSSGVTVQVAPTGTSSPAEHEDRVRRVMDALAASAFVADARRVSNEDARALVEPWLGDGALVAELPLPALIDVRLNDGAAIADLTGQLDRAAPGVTVEDPARWLGDLRRLARTVQALSIGIIGLIGGAAVASIIFAASSGFAVHRAEVELLHVMGATDGYVARQFQSHMLRQSLLGGGLGFLLALLTLWGLQQAGRGLDASLLPNMALGVRDWAWLPMVPVVACLLAAGTARMTVLRALGRLP